MEVKHKGSTFLLKGPGKEKVLKVTPAHRSHFLDYALDEKGHDTLKISGLSALAVAEGFMEIEDLTPPDPPDDAEARAKAAEAKAAELEAKLAELLREELADPASE